MKSEFDWKRPKLTLSAQASKLSKFPVKSNSVHISEAGGKIRTDMGSFYIRRSPLVVDCRQGLCVLAAISLCIEATAAFFLQFSKAPEALLLFPELLLRLR